MPLPPVVITKPFVAATAAPTATAPLLAAVVAKFSAPTVTAPPTLISPALVNWNALPVELPKFVFPELVRVTLPAVFAARFAAVDVSVRLPVVDVSESDVA